METVSPVISSADVNVRKAFVYSFDFDAYLNEVALGAGEIPKGPSRRACRM